MHYGPTAAKADDNIRDIGAFLRAGIDVCSTAMTPWVWPSMALNPPRWIEPITEACESGGASCFTTGIDPGFANDLFPMTLMGLCSEVRQVRALEILDYINYEGDYEEEMGIGRPPEFIPLLEHTDILAMSWGGTVPMMAHAVGVELDEITSTWEKWVTDSPITTAKGIIEPGEVAAIRFTINGIVHGEPRICLEHVNRCGTRRRPRLAPGQPERRLPGGDRRHAVDHPGDRVPVHRRQRPGRRRSGLPRHRAAGPQRGPLPQRPPAGVGHRPRSAAHPRGRYDPLTGPSRRARTAERGTNRRNRRIQERP